MIKAVTDPTMPIGRCAVLEDGDIVYSGRIGLSLIPFLKPGVVLLLNPKDFYKGEEFMQRANRSMN